ncbi:ribosome maturation factor RimP [Luteococcus sp. Sow4_B9]|uniref:ribosome maturation factor RimP n=1 Tax=Luteococcus sp. Sow4_B9 TaxID=3438792 RepID=UPI003F9A3843
MNERVVTPIITPVLESHGLELDHLDIIPAGKRKVLRITVDGDGPKGRGPLLDDIAAATRDISDALDASPEIGDAPFTLEVSSRGVGKPLTDAKHFRRNVGRLVLAILVDGSQLRGRLTEATEEQVTITEEPEPGKKLPKGLDPVHVLSLDEITKATIQVEMNRKPDPELDDLGEADEDDASDEADGNDELGSAEEEN